MWFCAADAFYSRLPEWLRSILTERAAPRMPATRRAPFDPLA